MSTEEKPTLEAALVGKENEEFQSSPSRTAGVSSSVYNLINGILGSGILVLPMSVSKFGYVNGCLFLALFAVLSACTCYMLSEVYYYTGSTSYAGMGGELFGKWAEVTINIIQVLYSLGSLFSYTIVVADESHFTAEHFLTSGSPVADFFLDRSKLLILISVLCILPPALFPKMDYLRFTSIIANICVIYLLIALGFHLPREGACHLAESATYTCSTLQHCVIERDPMHIIYENLTQCMDQCQHCPMPEKLSHGFKAFTFAKGAFFSLPFFCFSSTCQVQFVPLLAEMKDPSKKNVLKVLKYSFSSILSVYIIAGSFGYYSFCDYITNNILDAFPIHDIWIMICRIAIVIDMCFSIPLFSHPLRSMILDLMGVKNKKYWMIAVITVCILTLDDVIAIVFKNLGTVLGITGAVGASTIMMILPSIMYIMYLKKSGSKSFWKYFSSTFVLILGVVFAVLGTTATIQQS